MPTIPKAKPKYWERERTPRPKAEKVQPFNYSLKRWTRASLSHRRSNPLCVACLKEGRPEPATCVDHIIPISRGGAIWDKNNWQSLCDRHHKRKTIKEQRDYQPFMYGALSQARESISVCIVVFGNIASGKSTFCKELINELPEYKYVNLDQMRVETRAVDGMTDEWYEAEAKRRCTERLMNNRQTVYETIGSSAFFNDVIEELSNRAIIVYVYIKCDKDECIKRMYKRRASGYQEVILPFINRLTSEELIELFDDHHKKMLSHITIESDKYSTKEMIEQFKRGWGV